MQSRTVDLAGPVHFADFGGAGPVALCLHGLGGSHVTWMAVGPALARRWRVLAIDLPGFGRTPLAGRRTGLEANRRLLDRFVTDVVGGPAIVLGHAMGGTIALLEAALEPGRVAGLILAAPAVPKPTGVRMDRQLASSFATYATPALGTRALRRRRQRLGPEGALRASLRMACADPGRIPEPVLDAMLDFAVQRSHMPWADTAYVEAARSLVHWHTKGRWQLTEAIGQVKAPTLLIHGEGDRLVPLAAAQRATMRRPDWAFAVLDGVGHLPMLEDPRRFVSVVDQWSTGSGRQAIERARSTRRRGHEVA